jgi:hypothetical protein
MTNSPETFSSSDDGEYIHSIEKWGHQQLDDLAVSPEGAVELRRQYEKAHPGQHMDSEQFKGWLRALEDHFDTVLFRLNPDQEEELVRRYDIPYPDELVEPPLSDVAPPDTQNERPDA